MDRRLQLALTMALLAWSSSPSACFPWPDSDSAMVITATATPSSISSSSDPTPEVAQSTTPLPTPSSTVPSTTQTGVEQTASPPTQLLERPASVPPPQVRSLHVNSEVQYRYAHSVVSSRVANPANKSQEVTFSVVLPETAFISSFAMEIDGKVYKAYVKEKQEAQKTYDAAVQAGQSAAHVAVSARDSNSFTVSLNVEARNKVSFNLTYEELLTRKLGMYDHVITLNPGQVVDDLLVRVHIKEQKKINKLRVPEFSSGNKIDADLQECDDVITDGKPTKCASGSTLATITWKSPSEVEVLFRPNAEEQKEIADKMEEEKKKKQKQEEPGRFNAMAWSDVFQPTEEGAAGDKNSGLNGQFSVKYDVDRDATGGEVVVNEGYFVHFFSPSELKPLKKHAIFVLDVSGSMDGRKIEQLHEAMMAILEDLKEGDFFNLISFSSEVKVWNLDNPAKSAVFYANEGSPYTSSSSTGQPESKERPPAYPATRENIDKAKEIVKQMSAYGGTNINDALKTALACAREGTRPSAAPTAELAAERPEPIILFLTDGDPTVGLTVPSLITSGIGDLNQRPRSSIFSLAFGEGADVKFLRKLSLANGGFARTIYEAADASLQLKNFYRQISSPLLANVSFQYIPEKIERDSTTQLEFKTFFDGSELVVAGRTADKGIQELGGNVLAIAEGGKHASYTPQVTALDEPIAIYPFDDAGVEGPVFNGTQAPRHASVLERLWAYLTIKQLLDKQDALDASSVKEERIPPPVALPLPAAATTVTTATDAKAEDAVSNSTEPLQPKERALKLALKYSFVTPLTSLVVVKPNETKATDAQTVNPADGDPRPPLYGGAMALALPLAQPLVQSFSQPMTLSLSNAMAAPASAFIHSAPGRVHHSIASQPFTASMASRPALNFAPGVGGLMFGGRGGAPGSWSGPGVPYARAAPMGPMGTSILAISSPFPGGAPLVVFPSAGAAGWSASSQHQYLSADDDDNDDTPSVDDVQDVNAKAGNAGNARLRFRTNDGVLQVDQQRLRGTPSVDAMSRNIDIFSRGPTGNRIGGLSYAFAAAPIRGPPGPLSTRAPVAPGMAAPASSLIVGGQVAGQDEHEPLSHMLTPSTTAASVHDLMVNISDVKWLPEDALLKSTIELPLGVNGTSKSFRIASNETDPEPQQNCHISVEGSQSSNGVCRHFANCVLGQVTERIEDFAAYQCTIGDYLAICCPMDLDSTTISPSTEQSSLAP